jgi:hypothetical protein
MMRVGWLDRGALSVERIGRPDRQRKMVNKMDVLVV